MQVRLQKLIADCGITSRRKAEEYITDGRVKVNGELITTLGTKVDPKTDIVEVDNKAIDAMAVDQLYIILNKPRAYMTTVSDPEGRKTVMDLMRGMTARVFPVGRLDYLSEGLLIMTNDGDLANKIMHPKYEVTKVYEVKVFGRVTEGLLNKLKEGVHVDGELLRPSSVRVIEILPNKTWLEFRLNEGKNREIRRLCEAVGLTVDKLRRVAIGGLSVEGIGVGNFLLVNKNQLLNALGMNADGSKKPNAGKFVSVKKTIDLDDKRIAEGTKLADSQKFHAFRKETYYKTVEEIKKAKEEALAAPLAGAIPVPPVAPVSSSLS